MKVMARVSFLFLLLIAAVYPSPGQTLGTLTSNVNLRSEPSTSSSRIATLKKQTKVTLLSPSPTSGFFHVKTVPGQQGWVWAKSVSLNAAPGSRKLVRRPTTPEGGTGIEAAAAKRCATDLNSCPVSGCEPADSPHGLANQLKQTVPSGAATISLTFDDFASLQQQADGLVGENKELTAADRAKLKGLSVSNGTVSEGDVVSLLGFLVGVPHPNTGESVNCNLRGSNNNDFHIPVSNDPQNSDFQGIVVEMIPQSRPPEWNLANLTTAENNQQLVRVTGALFYDNFHFVNGDPNHPRGGQPHRFSLWEVHPITEFLLCTKSDNSCDPSVASDWVPIGTQ